MFLKDYGRAQELINELNGLQVDLQTGQANSNSQVSVFYNFQFILYKVKYMIRAKVYDLKQRMSQFERMQYYLKEGSAAVSSNKFKGDAVAASVAKLLS